MSLSFKESILLGIPDVLPEKPVYDVAVNHAPKRKDILTAEEKKLAIRNALRYFSPVHHAVLAREFYDELLTYGRIYMYRFRPAYAMYARPIEEYPFQSLHAAAIMMMIQNNLDRSASTSNVFFSSTARLAARLIAVVVFPTPPF